MLVDLLPLLRCPRTRAELIVAEDGSLVAERGIRYPVVGGVPVLVDGQRSVVDAEWVLAGRPARPAPDERRSRTARLARAAARRLPSSDLNVAAPRNHRHLVELLRVRAAGGRRPRVLVVGGGIAGSGSEELLGCAEIRLIETDIALAPRADVICDPHDLPFPEGAFDAVVIQAVLDGVLDPPRVASEVHRVLAADGLLYSEAGFMQQAHGAFDFHRFTHLGHRRLWRHFDEVDSGAQCGPGMSLLWSIEHYLRALAGRTRFGRAVVRRGVALAGFWLKYADHLLVRRPGGIDAASGTYFLGTRRETALSDRAILASFRGIPPAGQRLPAVRDEPAAEEEIRASRGIRIRRKERSAAGV